MGGKIRGLLTLGREKFIPRPFLFLGGDLKHFILVLLGAYTLMPGIVKGVDISTTTAKLGWVRYDDKIVLYDAKGSSIKTIETKEYDKSEKAEHGGGDVVVYSYRISGDVSESHKYAWTVTVEVNMVERWQKQIFRYFDGRGNMLWEKNGGAHATISADGEVVLLSHCDPNSLMNLTEGSEVAYWATIYSSSGAELWKFSEFSLRNPETIFIERNGRFGFLRSMVPENRVIFFDKQKQKISIYKGFGNEVSINHEGFFYVKNRKKIRDKSGKTVQIITTKVFEGNFD